MTQHAALFLAVAVMISFALLRHGRRYRQLRLLAVLGWALVWIDNRYTGSWPDYVGTGLVLLALAYPSVSDRGAKARCRSRRAHDESAEAD